MKKVPKNMPYLVHINDAWLDVVGHIIKGERLSWIDKRDGTRGIAIKGKYMRHYPRELSDKERGKHHHGSSRESN